ncbi:MAG TPA: ferritin-like domain-containing protein [Gemmatimonadaceae bacterium]|nr:ferritin-like domain-containing protein [Gemmatimonadaceae bacterium]
MTNNTVLGGIDPEITDRLLTRRDAISRGAATSSKVAVGLALASVPVALAALATDAFAATALPQDIIDVLNFALTLEYLESSFYNAGVGTSGLIPGSDLAIFQQIQKHENAHVAFLLAVLGSAAVAKPTFDFTAGGMFPDVFSNYATFQAVSQAFEDTGVRAYKGQAPNLMSQPDILTAALQIHSVEARHAAEVRRLRGLEGWIIGTMGNLPAAVNSAVYGPGNPPTDFPAEDNTVQGGVNLMSITNYGADPLSAAFDEPLDKATVLAIAGPFIAS